jgi:hypothetical protein
MILDHEQIRPHQLWVDWLLLSKLIHLPQITILAVGWPAAFIISNKAGTILLSGGEPHASRWQHCPSPSWYHGPRSYCSLTPVAFHYRLTFLATAYDLGSGVACRLHHVEQSRDDSLVWWRTSCIQVATLPVSFLIPWPLIVLQLDTCGLPLQTDLSTVGISSCWKIRFNE